MQQLRKLRSDQNQEVAQIKRFYLEVPSEEAQKNHPMGVTASVGNFVNPKVVDKIYEIVKTGNNSCFLLIIILIIYIFNNSINFVCMFAIDTD